MQPVFTIIAPVYNETESLDELYRQIREVMDTSGEVWELVLVDDGSKDGSTDKIREMAAADERVRPIIFARNFGHQIAVTAGMDYSRGQAVVIVDADLQDPPEVILQLIEKWREGFQVVYAVRAEREGETWFKKTTASLFYRLIFRITDVNIPLDTGDFRLLDRKVVDVMGQMGERHRFLRGMSAWAGFKQIGVPYNGRLAMRGDQIPSAQDVCSCIECDHWIFLRAASVGYLSGFHLRGDQYSGDHCGGYYAPFRQSSFLRTGDYIKRRVVFGRRAVDFFRDTRRIYWPDLR